MITVMGGSLLQNVQHRCSKMNLWSSGYLITYGQLSVPVTPLTNPDPGSVLDIQVISQEKNRRGDRVTESLHTN